MGKQVSGTTIGEYLTINLEAPYSAARYLEAIDLAEQAGVEYLVIDSLSHAWTGEGGLLDVQGNVAKRSGNSYTAWREVTPLPQLNESDRVLVALMMYEGLRRGEALGLTWDNVDFAENCIHITQQAAFNNGSNTATIQLPKTKKSIRTIPLVKPLKAILETIPVRGDYVVGNSKTPYTKSMLRKAMDRIKRILEIDDLHPHMFRYSHATVLHELGVDDKTIQHWEGHANQATTANIYIKNTQTMTDRAEAILSDFASANA